MIAAIVGLVLPVAAAWMTLRASGLRYRSYSRLVVAAAAFCLGVGAASALTFLTVMTGGWLGTPFVLADATLWLVVTGVGAWRLNRSASAVGLDPRAGQSPTLTRLDIALRVVFAVVAMLAFSVPVVEYLKSPHGQWDAWAIWNQKARFMYRAGPGWTAAMAIPWAQPAHPPLVTTSVARLWAYAGAELTVVPALLSATFAMAMVATVMGALGVRRQRSWVAGTVLIAPLTFSHLSAAQTADLPLGLFFAASLAMLPRYPDEWRLGAQTRMYLCVAGILATLAAWTKNEGLVFIGVASLLVVWSALRHGRVRDVAWWVAGAAPLAVVLLWFKTAVVPGTTDYLIGSDPSLSLTARLLDSDRVVTIVQAVWRLALRWGGPMAGGSLLVTLAVVGVLGAGREGRKARGFLVVTGGMIASYCLVYLLTPLDLVWLVSTTFERLTLQVWPVLVLAACASTDDTVRDF